MEHHPPKAKIKNILKELSVENLSVVSGFSIANLSQITEKTKQRAERGNFIHFV
jgi:hypothetical protein